MERATTSNTIGALAEALAKAQGSFPAIERNGEVEVETKRGGRYRFRYATLDAILAAVRKPLAENGLAVTQLITAGNGSPALRTLLIHGPSGEWIAADTPLPGSTDGPHEFGSDLTYKRRYSVAALLGVAPEEDDDGNAAQGNRARARQRQRARGNGNGGPTNGGAPQQGSQTPLDRLRAHVGRLGITPHEFRAYCRKRLEVEPDALNPAQVLTVLKVLTTLKDRSAWEGELSAWADMDALPGEEDDIAAQSQPAGRWS